CRNPACATRESTSSEMTKQASHQPCATRPAARPTPTEADAHAAPIVTPGQSAPAPSKNAVSKPSHTMASPAADWRGLDGLIICSENSEMAYDSPCEDATITLTRRLGLSRTSSAQVGRMSLPRARANVLARPVSSKPPGQSRKQ